MTRGNSLETGSGDLCEAGVNRGSVSPLPSLAGAGANPGDQPVSATGVKHDPDAPLASSRPSTGRAFPSQLTRFPHEKAQEAGYAAGAPPMGSVPDCAPRVRRTGKSATSSRSTKWSCSSTKRQPCP